MLCYVMLCYVMLCIREVFIEDAVLYNDNQENNK